MRTITSSDWLISENKNGGEKYWRLHILKDGADYYTQSEWYQMGKLGSATKSQTSECFVK